MPDRGRISKIKQVLLTSPDEEVVDIFKPVQYKNIMGILILTDKQVIFTEVKGTIFKSYKAVFSVKLLDLAAIEKVRRTAKSYIKLGQFEVSSPDLERLVKFFDGRIFSQVQRSKGLVEYKGEWMTPEEKFEREQVDKGLVQFKGEWLTPEEKFEREQLDKGLVKYKGSWMAQEEKFEKEMLDKGLVKYKGQWITPEEKFEKEQKAKGLVRFMGRWGTLKQVDKWKKLYVGLTCDFMDRSPKEFEQFIAELFTKMGYSTSTTPLSADYGADVIAKKDHETIAVQVKRYKLGSKVGVKDVNQVLGSMYRYSADKAIVITTSNFTRAARKLARTAPVELWNRAKLYEKIEQHFFGDSGPSIVDEISKEREAKTRTQDQVLRPFIEWYSKAKSLFKLGKYEDAIEAWDWVAEYVPQARACGLEITGEEEIWIYKGVCYAKLGRFEKAIKSYDKALKINPESQLAKDNRAIAQMKLQKSPIPSQKMETEAIVAKEKEQVCLPLTKSSIGKEAVFYTIHYVPFCFKVRLLGYNYLGKVIQGDTGKGTYEAEGEILEVKMELTNLSKEEQMGNNLRYVLVLEDEDGYRFQACDSKIQEMYQKSSVFKFPSADFLPKIPKKCSILFEVPKATNKYRLTVRSLKSVFRSYTDCSGCSHTILASSTFCPFCGTPQETIE